VLASKINALGVPVHLNKNTKEVLGNGKVEGMAFADGSQQEVRGRRKHGGAQVLEGRAQGRAGLAKLFQGVARIVRIFQGRHAGSLGQG